MTRSLLLRLIAERHLRLFVEHQGAGKAVRIARSWHIHAHRQHSGNALLQIQDVGGSVVLGEGIGFLLVFIFFSL